MHNAKNGRNEPCPCGSGKKYKHCCLRRGNGPASQVGRELEEQLAGQPFESLEQARDFADSFMQQRNRAPLDEFHGLSPDQVARLLYTPLDPQLVRFPDTVAISPEGPAMTLLNVLVDAMGEQGLKATAKGNLPQRLCIEAGEAYRAHDDGSLISMKHRRIHREDDLPELTAVRRAAQMAGLLRKYKGRFAWTRRFRERFDKAGPGGVYPLLLEAHATRLNWAWFDRYPELPFIQQSFAFVLYLLTLYGGEERLDTFYEDAYLRAFPMLLDEVAPGLYSDAEDQLRNCFTVRTLQRFAWFMGLVTMKRARDDVLCQDWLLRKTPVLDAAVIFGEEVAQRPYSTPGDPARGTS